MMKTDNEKYDEYIAVQTKFLSSDEHREDAQFYINALNLCRDRCVPFDHAILLIAQQDLGISPDEIEMIAGALEAGVSIIPNDALYDSDDDSDFHVKI